MPPYTPQPAVQALRNLGPYLSTVRPEAVDLQIQRFVFSAAREAGESSERAAAFAQAVEANPGEFRERIEDLAQGVPERAQQIYQGIETQAARHFMEYVEGLDLSPGKFAEWFGAAVPVLASAAAALPYLAAAYALWQGLTALTATSWQRTATLMANSYGQRILLAEIPITLRDRLGVDDPAQVERLTERLWPMVRAIYWPWLENLGADAVQAAAEHNAYCDDWTNFETCYFWTDLAHADWGAVNVANDVNRDGVRDSLARVIAGMIAPRSELVALQPAPPEITTPQGWNDAPAAGGGALPLLLVGGLFAALN